MLNLDRFDGIPQNYRHLVLSRRQGQRVCITLGSERLIVELDQVKGSQARIGFYAPADVEILREEIAEKRPA